MWFWTCQDSFMPWRPGSQVRIWVFVTISACLVAGAVIVLFVAPAAALGPASARVGLLAALLALPPAIGAVMKIGRDTAQVPLPLPEGALDGAQGTLASQVEQKWRRDHTDRWLNRPGPMVVRWHPLRLGVMGDQFAAGRAPAIISGRSDRISSLATKFRELPTRRLVILGNAGSGKTTLAIQLLLELAASRQPGDPVPVLMPLSGWDTRAHPRFRDWLVARLSEMYPALREGEFKSRLPLELVRESRVLPVLDGLDELTEEARSEVILALNRSLTDPDQLILTSRTAEYKMAVDQAGQVLSRAVAIESEPLRPGDIAQYIAACLQEVPSGSSDQQAVSVSWQAVLSALGTGNASTLLSVTSAPIGLWLLRAVYIEARPESRPDPQHLLDASQYPDSAAMQAHLFEKLIPALIEAHDPSSEADDLFRPRHKWKPADVRRWLGYLASQLKGEPNPGMSWWKLASYTLPTWQILLFFGVACAAAAALIIAFGSSAGVASRIHGGLTFGIIGLIIGGGSGAALWLAFADSGARWLDYDHPSAAEEWLRRLLRRHIVGGLAAGLLFGLVGGPLVGVIEGLVAGLTFGIVSGLTFGVAGGLTFGLVGEVTFRVVSWADRQSAASTPRSTLRNDRALSLSSAFIVGVTYGLIFGVAVGLAIGIANLLAGGLAGKETHAWAIYVMASLQVAARRQLPVRLMGFLDDAHRVGLLRTVGPRYQFRHAELQNYLADASRAAP